MKLIVFYSVALKDIEDKFYQKKCYVLVNVPEDLKQSEYYDYVVKNYFIKIFNLELDCNSDVLVSLKIEDVNFITML